VSRVLKLFGLDPKNHFVVESKNVLLFATGGSFGMVQVPGVSARVFPVLESFAAFEIFRYAPLLRIAQVRPSLFGRYGDFHPTFMAQETTPPYGTSQGQCEPVETEVSIQKKPSHRQGHRPGHRPTDQKKTKGESICVAQKNVSA
jgi:hypothetical protein